MAGKSHRTLLIIMIKIVPRLFTCISVAKELNIRATENKFSKLLGQGLRLQYLHVYMYSSHLPLGHTCTASIRDYVVDTIHSWVIMSYYSMKFSV